jgi:hypothetical protein
MCRIASLIARWLAPHIIEELAPTPEPLAYSHVIARWLAPHIIEELAPTLEPLAYGHVITRQMIEDLANDLGREITFDLQTGVVTIHALKH